MLKKRKLLYIGSLMPNILIDKFISLSLPLVDFATNNYQRALLSSLMLTDCEIDAISCPFIRFDINNIKSSLSLIFDRNLFIMNGSNLF